MYFTTKWSSSTATSSINEVDAYDPQFLQTLYVGIHTTATPCFIMDPLGLTHLTQPYPKKDIPGIQVIALLLGS
jgi:hypothetical protein